MMFVILYIQSLPLNNLKKTMKGTYLCLVKEALKETRTNTKKT